MPMAARKTLGSTDSNSDLDLLTWIHGTKLRQIAFILENSVRLLSTKLAKPLNDSRITLPMIKGTKRVTIRLLNSWSVGNETPTPPAIYLDTQNGIVKMPNKLDATVTARARAEFPPASCNKFLGLELD